MNSKLNKDKIVLKDNPKIVLYSFKTHTEAKSYYSLLKNNKISFGTHFPKFIGV